MTNYMLNGKAAIVLLTVGLIKKTVWKSEYFPKPRTLEGGKEGEGRWCESWIRFI